jgi:tetratricopeptide (TPR) repeat protein/CHAT domain-containing protein
MRYVLMSLFAGLLIPAVACGQQVPEATKEGKEALQKLVDACVADGGLKPLESAKGKRLTVRDEDKIRATVAAHPELLTPPLRDALSVGWFGGNDLVRPAYLALLWAYGKEKKDELALGFAAFIAGEVAYHQQQYSLALPLYHEAQQHFGAAKDLGWQGASFSNIGKAYLRRAEYDKALDYLQRGLAVYQELYDGPDPNIATSLHDIGLVYHAHLEYDKALDFLQRALVMYQKVYSGPNSGIANSLNNIGKVYDDQGKHAQALDYLQRAVDMYQKVYKPPHPAIASCLGNIGEVYQHQGKYAEALDYHQQALRMTRKLYDGPQPDIASGLHNIGKDYFAQGDDAEALDHFQRALAMTQELYEEPHPHIAASLVDIAMVYNDQGEQTKALGLLQRALAMQQKLHVGPHPVTAICLDNLGEVSRARGDYARALDYHQRALAMERKLYEGQNQSIATSLSNIGADHLAQGEYAHALDYFQRALAIDQELYKGPHPDMATGLNNIAAVYNDLGEYVQALDYHQRALAMWQKLYEGPHLNIATSLNNIGFVHDKQGEYGKALDYYLQALAVLQKVYEGPHPAIATCLDNIGGVWRAQGDYARALDYHQRALAMERKLYGSPHPDLARANNNIAGVYYEQGKYAEALQSWDEALGVLRLAPATEPTAPIDRLQARDLRPLPVTVDVVGQRGLVSEKVLTLKPTSAELRACERTYALASDLLDRVRHESTKTEADRLRQGADRSGLTPHRVSLCRRLLDLDGDPRDLAMAFEAAEQGRARVFLEELAASHASLLGGVSPELRAKEAEFTHRVREYDVRIAREESNPGKADTPLPRLWEGRQQAEAELLKLVAQMEKEYTRYAALKYPKPCSVEAARACLDPNEVALHFVLGKEESYALLLEVKPAPGDKGKGLAIFTLPGRDAIADQVTALADPDTLALPARVRDLGAELYAKLLAPLADRLRGKDLVIVPDGPLGYLPFELLVEPAEGGGRFLVEGHRIRYAPSLTALHLGRLWVAQRERQPDRLLWAMGDPVYGPDDDRLTGNPALAAASRDAERELAWREGQGTERFGRLRYSGQEVEKIRERLGEAGTVLLGKDATETAVRQASAEGELARARYVHFACHGVLGLGDGQPPALVLSLVGNSGERDEFGVLDGFLRLDEVTNLKLNADLVVLSACRSGQGRLYNGEGVHGLARAFLHAGSKGVVCSLWSVDDKETADFMAAFYGRLKDGRSAADALRETRLDMIHAGKAPLYWAPFVLIGE